MGEQVADNKEPQRRLELKMVEGELFITDQRYKVALVKNSYHPIGNSLIYPAKWGRITATKYFIDYLIKEQKRIIKDAEGYIELLKNAKY